MKKFITLALSLCFAFAMGTAVFAETATDGQGGSSEGLLPDSITTQEDAQQAIEGLRTINSSLRSYNLQTLESVLAELEAEYIALNGNPVAVSTASGIYLTGSAFAFGGAAGSITAAPVETASAAPYAISINASESIQTPVFVEVYFPESMYSNFYDFDIKIRHIFNQGGDEYFYPVWYLVNDNDMTTGVVFATNSFSTFEFYVESVNVDGNPGSDNNNAGGGSTSPIKSTASGMNFAGVAAMLVTVTGLMAVATKKTRKENA